MPEPSLDVKVKQRLEEDAQILGKLEPALSKAESQRLGHLRQIATLGFDVATARCRESGKLERRTLALEFVTKGVGALFSSGAQRGGDFLLNQLRGRWAEEVVLSMRIDKLALVAFGPTGAAMPGEEDYHHIRMTFDTIRRLERKRPDLLAFEASQFATLADSERQRIADWPNRPLVQADYLLIEKAKAGIEVKNSTWMYGVRRKAGGDALSITIKEEERDIFEGWSGQWNLPIIFVQVFFDEAYVMSFKRMQERIASGNSKKDSPHSDNEYYRDQQSSEKDYHHLYTGLKDQSFRCGDVTFPGESKGRVRWLEDGSVIPYIKFAPIESSNIRSEVIWAEIDY